MICPIQKYQYLDRCLAKHPWADGQIALLPMFQSANFVAVSLIWWKLTTNEIKELSAFKVKIAIYGRSNGPFPKLGFAQEDITNFLKVAWTGMRLQANERNLKD